MGLDLTDLADLARKRLRGRNALTAEKKSLVLLTRTTTKQLNATAKEISKAVGFHVWPNQLAALLVEQGLRG